MVFEVSIQMRIPCNKREKDRSQLPPHETGRRHGFSLTLTNTRTVEQCVQPLANSNTQRLCNSFLMLSPSPSLSQKLVRWSTDTRLSSYQPCLSLSHHQISAQINCQPTAYVVYTCCITHITSNKGNWGSSLMWFWSGLQVVRTACFCQRVSHYPF